MAKVCCDNRVPEIIGRPPEAVFREYDRGREETECTQDWPHQNSVRFRNESGVSIIWLRMRLTPHRKIRHR